eukprot:TRINITY_DN109812_c0_g1_i1.p1 TRINITY_DN109812_c0_g1~~TRINITY_DN109812_c0_g1_i1.p1  ORF type:complete len:268 (+),score=35.65 TRINITY_DN109812_c0_g1_i1:85-804(+)
MARQTFDVNLFGALKVIEKIFRPVHEALQATNQLADGSDVIDARIVSTCSGAGRLNLGRMLDHQDVEKHQLADRVLKNSTNLRVILETEAEAFISDYEETVSSLKKAASSGSASATVAWPAFGKNYYLSSYGFSKALLHQSMKILVSENSDTSILNDLGDYLKKQKIPVCGCFPGVVRTRMNALAKDQTSMRDPKDGASVLYHLGIERPIDELLADNKRGWVLYNPKFEVVKEYFERSS